MDYKCTDNVRGTHKTSCLTAGGLPSLNMSRHAPRLLGHLNQEQSGDMAAGSLKEEQRSRRVFFIQFPIQTPATTQPIRKHHQPLANCGASSTHHRPDQNPSRVVSDSRRMASNKRYHNMDKSNQNRDCSRVSLQYLCQGLYAHVYAGQSRSFMHEKWGTYPSNHMQQ